MSKLTRKTKENYPATGTGKRAGERLARQLGRGLLSTANTAALRHEGAKVVRPMGKA